MPKVNESLRSDYFYKKNRQNLADKTLDLPRTQPLILIPPEADEA
jgi:hypothetical protein